MYVGLLRQGLGVCALIQTIMKLDDEVKIIFKNEDSKIAEITISVNQLLECTKDDLYEMLEETIPCTCNINESCNHCECNPNFEDYEIVEVLVS